MQVIKTIVGHHLKNMFPENVAFHIASFLEEDMEQTLARQMYESMVERLYAITSRGRKMQFRRYCKNLRYDSFFVYSYDTAVIQLNWRQKTAKRLGKWSKTTSTHMNYAIKMLIMSYDFEEVK